MTNQAEIGNAYYSISKNSLNLHQVLNKENKKKN